MKILKYLGIGLLVLIVLILIAGLAQPTHFAFKKSLIVNSPKEVVFDKINNLKNWALWEPWQTQDSSMVVTYGAKTEGLGASYSWVGDSEKSGSGKMTISESISPALIRTSLEFEGQGKGEGFFELEDAQDGETEVTWGFSFDVPFPFNAFTIFSAGAMKKQMNDMFVKGLNKLKEICEGQASDTYRGYEVKAVDYAGATYVGIAGNVKIDPKAIEEFFAQSFGTIKPLLNSGTMETAGPPSGLYYDFNEQTGITNMVAAIPIKPGAGVSGGPFKLIELPAGRCVMIDYYGSYSGTAEAHYAIDDYLKEKGLEYIPPVIEEYVTDPGAEPDSSKWLTRIIYILK